MVPKQIELERAAFEAWYCDFIGVPNRLREAFIARVRENKSDAIWEAWLARAKQSSWISVEERQPEPNQLVLMLITNGKKDLIDIGYCRKGKGLDRVENLFCNGFKPTYWQPLPGPIPNSTNEQA